MASTGGQWRRPWSNSHQTYNPTVPNPPLYLQVALQEEAEADWTERLAAREEELRKTLEEEKRDLLIRAESEKNLLKQQLTEERAALRTR